MRYLKFCLLWLVLISSPSVFAGGLIEVVKSDGGLTVSDTAGANSKPAGQKSVLPASHILSTGPNGRAVVKIGDTGYIVLEKNSKVEVNQASDNAGFFRQVTGMIYYAVNTIKGRDRTLEVRTKTATMGIRGTRFLVAEVPGRNEVGMRKGTLSVLSPNEEFEIHRQAELEEFAAFKREAKAAIDEDKRQFEEYKNDAQREIVEYKKEFSLGKDRMASFNGKRVDDRPLSTETKQDLNSAEMYAEEWIKDVHD